jgi:hypothetical protein
VNGSIVVGGWGVGARGADCTALLYGGQATTQHTNDDCAVATEIENPVTRLHNSLDIARGVDSSSDSCAREMRRLNVWKWW